MTRVRFPAGGLRSTGNEVEPEEGDRDMDKSKSKSKSTRKPGSLVAAGCISAPSHLRYRDRERAVSNGSTLDWRRASSRVRGL